MDFIVKGKKITSYDLKKQILSEIRQFLVDNGLLTMFYEKSNEVLTTQRYIHIYKIDDLAIIANKILMPYFVMYLHQYGVYRGFRERWKELLANNQKKRDYILFPPFILYYGLNKFIKDEVYVKLYSWDWFITDIVYLKDEDMSFFKPNLKTRIIDRLMKIW